MRHDHDLHWLGLLDELYALIECDDTGAALAAGTPEGWPVAWQPLAQRWAQRIGARSIQIAPALSLQSPGCEAGHLSHRRVTGEVVRAQSASPHGFTDGQVQEFHAFCSHLERAASLRSSLEATQASLESLQGAIDALPTSLVLIDEHGEVVLLNRPAREWLARTARAGVEAGRLRLSAGHVAFERALHQAMSAPFAQPQALQLNGLDLQLQRLPGATVSVLLLVHERCDLSRLREITVPPPALALQLRRAHALTEREVPLAWNLAQGMPLKQYAALSGRSVETVRAQLKSVFRKLGASGQKDIGVILFEALQSVTLQSVGPCLAGLAMQRAAALPGPVGHLSWT